MISFVVGLHQRSGDSLARVNIFLSTGTIGTSRVLGGKVRQTFRRNVTSLDVIGRLLKHPDELVKIDEGLIGVHDKEVSPKALLDSPRSLQKELELADVGLCILQGEREKLVNHLEALAPSTPAQQKGGCWR